MPITRTYMCPECAMRIEVVLDSQDWDKPPPSCEFCDARAMNQEFHPPAIGGSNMSKAAKLAEEIMATDYKVANFTPDGRVGGTGKVRYKDETAGLMPSSFQKAQHAEMLQTAIGIGRQNRREFGPDGLDMLRKGIMEGTQVDLIEASKRRSIKVW